MLIYKKYIIKSIFPPLLILIFVLTGLVWITQILKLLYLIDRGIKFKDFLQLVTLIVPSLLFMIMPVVTVLSVIYVYNKLQEDRQLTILRSSGLSNLSIAKPALIVASLITLFSYYISAHLMPVSYNNLKHKINSFRENYVSKIIDARTFNQISKYVTIYVDNKNYDGSLEGIVLFDNKTPQDKTVFFAKFGEIIMKGKTPVFELREGLRQSYDNKGNLTKLYFEDLAVEVGQSNEDIPSRSKTSLELFIHEMIWPDSTLSTAKQNRLITDGHQRLIWPFYNFVFAFIALSVFLKQPYNRKSHIKQMLLTFFPVILVAYFHFTLQKLAYEKSYFTFISYMNVSLSILFSIWQINRNRI